MIDVGIRVRVKCLRPVYMYGRYGKVVTFFNNLVKVQMDGDRESSAAWFYTKDVEIVK